MRKAIAIPIMVILVIVIIGGGFFLFQQMGKLDDAESDIVDLEENVTTLEGEISSLEGDVSNLEGNVSTLEKDLADSEATVTTLQSDLDIANNKVSNLQGDLSTQRNINTTLSQELKLIKDPRHFSSVQELTDWLEQDDTDTKYAGQTTAKLSFILQVRALRDGYLLPAFIVNEDGINVAVIGDEFWGVNPEDDDTEFAYYIEPIPSHPLPLD